MFKSKTLFVVGAGASAEAGLPVGSKLKSIISSKLNLNFDLIEPRSGDQVVARAILEHCASSDGSRDIHLFEAACHRIRDAMPLATSIDTFIESHNDDSTISFCGKLAIVRAIAEEEKSSRLYFDNQARNNSTFFTKIDDSWFIRLFNALTVGLNKSNIHNIFENVSFIVFNYDRCLEHFLLHALITYFGLPREDASGLIGGLRIVHPYGVIGRLPWLSNIAPTSFGQDILTSDLIDRANQIRTFTERVDDIGQLEHIRSFVSNAETVVFLGFGYHEQNLNLISPVSGTSIQRVFGTARSISDSDLRVVRQQVSNSLKVQNDTDTIKLNNKLNCAPFIDEYWRSISDS